MLLEGNAGFPGDVAQLLDHGQNQGHAFLAPHLFHLAFGIAGDQRAVGARRRFGGTKDADVVVDLTLEGITIHKAVDAMTTDLNEWHVLFRTRPLALSV